MKYGEVKRIQNLPEKLMVPFLKTRKNFDIYPTPEPQFSVAFKHYDIKLTSNGKYGLKYSKMTPEKNILCQVYHVKWFSSQKF